MVDKVLWDKCHLSLSFCCHLHRITKPYFIYSQKRFDSPCTIVEDCNFDFSTKLLQYRIYTRCLPTSCQTPFDRTLRRLIINYKIIYKDIDKLWKKNDVCAFFFENFRNDQKNLWAWAKQFLKTFFITVLLKNDHVTVYSRNKVGQNSTVFFTD